VYSQLQSIDSRFTATHPTLILKGREKKHKARGRPSIIFHRRGWNDSVLFLLIFDIGVEEEGGKKTTAA
jgi:hypothetical protein